MDFGIASFAAIAVVCYLIAQGVKATSLDNKWLPVICGAVGAVLGVICLVLKVPDFPAEDYVTAIAVGVVSGLAATGANQIYKQLSKNKNSKEE